MRTVAAIVAALGIVLLVVYGGDDRELSGRDREGFQERAAQALVAAPAIDPAPVMLMVEEQGQDRLSAETAAQLGEVRDLLAAAAGQPPEQATATLEQAHETLAAALSQIALSVNEAPDHLTKLRLLHLQRLLEAIQGGLETRLSR